MLGEALDEGTRSTVETLLREENAQRDKERRQVSAWRRRAEELRSVADHFAVPSVQETLRRTAFNLDKMANHSEALLTGKHPEPRENVG